MTSIFVKGKLYEVKIEAIMHFKQPEILYFLFLLIVPILVHLFQLRRFKTSFFTNVRFLKELAVQTRKSSKIKKRLLLTTRLLLLTCVILAFAQPFFEAKDSKNATNEMYIVLDNSFSMQLPNFQIMTTLGCIINLGEFLNCWI